MDQQALRQSVIAEAEKWVNARARWRHNACVPYEWADCGQILIDIYWNCGLIAGDRPNPGNYSRQWALHNCEENYLNLVEQYAHPVDRPQMGDIAVYKFGRCFSHGAIVVDYPRIIHAHVKENVCYSSADQGELRGREVKFYSVIDDRKDNN